MNRLTHFVFTPSANAVSGLCSFSKRSERSILLAAFIGIEPLRHIELLFFTIT